jgi:diguanylate cyclase (GGDEF)-like protein
MPRSANILAIVPGEQGASAVLQRFEAMGITVQTATDCLTAMGIVKSEDVDMVVLVGATGQFNLADTTRVLKSLRTDRYLPVVAVVDAGQPPERREALREAGVDEMVPADAGAEMLQCRLHSILRLKSVYDQLHQVQAELDKTLARETALLKQLREDNRALKVRSITDGLTALYNYRYLMEWLKTEFKISRRYGHPLSMVIIDLDHFKNINDEHGHPFGDYALKEVAVILKECARDSDLVARYAGDEFALVCPRTGRTEVQALAKRILMACRKHNFVNKDKHVPLALSVGTATYPEDAEVVSPELLVFLADQALYHTKRLGRDGVTSWHEIDPETRVAIRRELRGPQNPLLGDDPKSRLELAAAARLTGTAAEPASLRPGCADLPSEP